MRERERERERERGGGGGALILFLGEYVLASHYGNLFDSTGPEEL